MYAMVLTLDFPLTLNLHDYIISSRLPSLVADAAQYRFCPMDELRTPQYRTGSIEC